MSSSTLSTQLKNMSWIRQTLEKEAEQPRPRIDIRETGIVCGTVNVSHLEYLYYSSFLFSLLLNCIKHCNIYIYRIPIHLSPLLSGKKQTL